LDSLGVWMTPPNLPTDLSTGIVDIPLNARRSLDSRCFILSQYAASPRPKSHVRA